MKNQTSIPSGLTARFSTMMLVALLSINAYMPAATGQGVYKIVAGSQIKVSGTSNMHDWTMVASSFTCEGNFAIKAGQLEDISSLSFSLPVANLKSKESVMDSRAYKALNAEKYPRITFKLTGAIVLPQQRIVKATGMLTIAGVSNQVELQTAYLSNPDGTITCKGSKSVKMSEYKIKPPTFMLGALKVGNEVIIDLVLKLSKSPKTAI